MLFNANEIRIKIKFVSNPKRAVLHYIVSGKIEIQVLQLKFQSIFSTNYVN
jgi:hypothetical protein